MKTTPVTIERDGNAWVAKRAGFVNLQESIAGYGDTELDALRELLEKEVRGDK